MIRAVLFDFGGVLAEEGFREAIRAAAKCQGLDPDEVFGRAESLIYETGYLTGRAPEAAFWEALRKSTGLAGSDRELREAVLGGFALRPEVMGLVDELRRAGLVVGILSDQTDWLETLDRGQHFYGQFDFVFNSYRMGRHKRNPSVFSEAAGAMGLSPGEVLFVDDKESNIQRAVASGMKGVVFTDTADSLREIRRRLGLLPSAPGAGRSCSGKGKRAGRGRARA